MLTVLLRFVTITLMLFGAFSVTSADSILRVEVFYDRPEQVSGLTRIKNAGIQIHVHDLSQVNKIQASLSKGLSGNPQLAEKEILQRLNADTEAKQQLGVAWAARVRAQQLGVRSVPAIVINGHIYTSGDLIGVLKAWRKETGAQQ